MALSASTVWEVRTGGSDTNGGGFTTGGTGTDYSQQNSKNPNGGTDGSSVLAVAAGTTTITCADAQFATTIVDNVVYFAGGTGAITGVWRRVTARASTTSITIDTAIAASTGMTMNVGGALFSVGQASINLTVAGMIAYLKNEGSVFSVTSTSSTASGVIQPTATLTWIVGYSTNRSILPVSGTTLDAPPTVQTNVSTATVIGTTSNYLIVNVIFDGNSQTAARLVNTASVAFWFCQFKNFNTASGTSSSFFIGCLATGNSATVVLGTLIAYSEAYGNTATPINGQIIINTLTYSNTGASTDGATGPTSGTMGFVSGLTSVANGRDGFRTAGTSSLRLIQNSIFQSNTGFGYNNLTQNLGALFNNGFFNNTSGATNSSAPSGYVSANIAYTADAFTNLAGNVYSLNNLAGAGAALRALAIPALFPRGLTPDYADVGAVQSQSAGANIFPIFD